MTLIAASREEIQTASLASLRVTSLAPMVMPYSFLEEPRASKHTSHSLPSRLMKFPEIIHTASGGIFRRVSWQEEPTVCQNCLSANRCSPHNSQSRLHSSDWTNSWRGEAWGAGRRGRGDVDQLDTQRECTHQLHMLRL